MTTETQQLLGIRLARDECATTERAWLAAKNETRIAEAKHVTAEDTLQLLILASSDIAPEGAAKTGSEPAS